MSSRVLVRSDATLAIALAVLASPTRLALLRTLRAPRTLHEIRVRGEGSEEEPLLARQSVKDHLERLERAGVVTSREGVGPRGPTTEYLLNHLRVYEIAEELRELAHVRSTEELALQTTPQQVDARPAGPRPCLVLVRGLGEGNVFRLPTSRAETATVGRARSSQIALDFDAAVSHEHCAIQSEEDGHAVSDLASRNGTRVNFVTLQPGERRRLAHGDILGVGRTLLVYWR